MYLAQMLPQKAPVIYGTAPLRDKGGVAKRHSVVTAWQASSNYARNSNASKISAHVGGGGRGVSKSMTKVTETPPVQARELS